MHPARDNAASIVRDLRAAGHAAYFAGGCVRDELLGLVPDDYDVATAATPDQVRALGRAKRWRVNEVGVSFGVLLVRTPAPDGAPPHDVVEVATFREEGVYSDSRRPDEVRFSTASADARRRDFTINALFLGPLDAKPEEPGAQLAPAPLGGWVVDFVEGRADLARRTLRAVGEASARLREDHLRALRGVRLSSRLGFEIESATREAIARDASSLTGVSRERIGDEVRRMFAHPTRAAAAAALQDLGLDAPTLDEPSAAPALPLLRALAPEAPLEAALGAWALDRHGADASADDIASRWRRALCLSNEETGALRDALHGVRTLEAQWPSWGVAPRKRAAASPWFAAASALLDARNPESGTAVRTEMLRLAATPGGIAPAPLVTGDDLVALGFRPGPAFKDHLERLYDLQLEGTLPDRAAALQMAKQLAG